MNGDVDGMLFHAQVWDMAMAEVRLVNYHHRHWP